MKLWDLKLDKNVMDQVPVSLIVCVVSHSSRSKPDAGMSDFREAVIVLLFTDRVWIRDANFWGY